MFDTLTTEQRAAVEHLGGPLLVVAGAGSGKT
jgi:superfamily I DNA/RNA helicase